MSLNPPTTPGAERSEAPECISPSRSRESLDTPHAHSLIIGYRAHVHTDQGTPIKISPRLVYTRHYNIGFFGLERLHPFDSRKYGRAWKALRRRFGSNLNHHWIHPPAPISHLDLLKLHTPQYLQRLRDPKFVATVLEVPPVRRLPGWLVDRCVLRPMRWATMGTVIAAQAAMQHRLAVNLSGGYHHASPDNGHGFYAYADVGIAIQQLRATGQLTETEKVLYVDLDAHQGNGVCRTFESDPRLFIYDQYAQPPHNRPAQWWLQPPELSTRRPDDRVHPQQLDLTGPISSGAHQQTHSMFDSPQKALRAPKAQGACSLGQAPATYPARNSALDKRTANREPTPPNSNPFPNCQAQGFIPGSSR